MIHRRLVPLAIVLGLVASGCAGATEEASTESAASVSTAASPSPPPKGSKRFSTPDFFFYAPKNWRDSTGQAQQAVIAVMNASDNDGFADNVNVIRLDPAPITDLDELEEALQTELENAGAKDIEVLDRVQLDGVEAVHDSAVMSAGESEYRIEQFNAISDGVSFVVTISHNTDADPEAMAKDIDTIISTWTWK